MLCLETDLSLCGGSENVTSTVRLHMCSECIPSVPMSDIGVEITVPDAEDRGQHHCMQAARQVPELVRESGHPTEGRRVPGVGLTKALGAL